MRTPELTSILSLTHNELTLLREEETVSDVLERFRTHAPQHKIIYLYVVDDQDHLLGVLPIRRLLAARPETRVGEICLRNIVSLARKTPPTEARAAFSKHRFLAFPVVDEENRLVGVIDIETFAGDLGDLTARTSFDDVYALFGVDLSSMQTNSARERFRLRFPWLIATLASGILAAMLVSLYEVTLQQTLVLAFFMTLVLGLNESVSMQSMAFAIHSFHQGSPSWKDYKKILKKELTSGLLLGSACALASGGAAYFWRGEALSAFTISLSLVISIVVATFWGLSVPYSLHSLQKDPKVAASPIVLALTDLSTLFIYFTLACWILS